MHYQVLLLYHALLGSEGSLPLRQTKISKLVRTGTLGVKVYFPRSVEIGKHRDTQA